MERLGRRPSHHGVLSSEQESTIQMAPSGADREHQIPLFSLQQCCSLWAVTVKHSHQQSAEM